MDPLLATLVLILLALLGARFSFSSERVPPGWRLLFRTGTHFLLVGFALGPGGLGLLSTDATEQLFPFLALGLGWVGFQFGLQLHREILAHFRWPMHAIAIGQAVLAFGIFYGGGRIMLRLLGLEGDVPSLLVLGAAATACITTPAGIAMVSSNFLVKGNVRDLLFFIASLDAGIGILALQIIYAVYRPDALAAGLPAQAQPSLVVMAAGLGAVCGIVFLWLTRPRPRAEELVLFVLGISAFASGAALRLGLSPLFVSVVMGALVANLGPGGPRVSELLARWEKPVYVVFLLLAGALLRFPTPWVVLLALGYAVLRGIAKVLGAMVMVAMVPMENDVPKRLGLGLVPQGGISLAMAVSGVLVYSHVTIGDMDADALLFAIVITGVMISELTGPFFTVHVLRRAGEISPAVEEALAQGDEERAEKAAIRHAINPESDG